MYLVSRCDKGLYKGDDYEEVLKVLSKLPEISLYDLNTFIKLESNLDEEIREIVKILMIKEKQKL